MRKPLWAWGEGVLLGALALAAAILWLRIFAPVFSLGFLADDSWFLAVSPPSLHDIAEWFLRPQDESGYYRPFARLLWSWSSWLGASAPSEFQLVTLALLFGGAAFLFTGLRALHGNVSLAIAGAAAFVFSLVHAKSLFWLTLWFNTSSAFFAAGTFAFFCLHARSGRRWQRRAGLLCLAGAYASNNAMHSFALAPALLDLAFLDARAPGERGREWLARYWRRARDHLLPSLAFFAFIYVYGNPFSRAIHYHIRLLDPENLQALANYVTASFWHPFGDGSMPEAREYPWPVRGATYALLAVLAVGSFWRRRLLAPTALVLGGGIVISLLHERWQVEYGAPVAVGVAALLSTFLAELIQLAGRARAALSFVLAAAWILGAATLAQQGLPRFTADLQKQGESTMRFLESVRELDRTVPRGQVFLFTAMEGPTLRAAPFAHFAMVALWELLPGRAYLFRPGIFESGEGPGLQDEEGAWTKENLGLARPFVPLACGPGGCRRVEAP